jgi:hypothetical protein
MFCKRLFPLEDFIATDRSKKFHTGLVDSCAIAVYCWRQNKK